MRPERLAHTLRVVVERDGVFHTRSECTVSVIVDCERTVDFDGDIGLSDLPMLLAQQWE